MINNDYNDNVNYIFISYINVHFIWPVTHYCLHCSAISRLYPVRQLLLPHIWLQSAAIAGIVLTYAVGAGSSIRTFDLPLPRARPEEQTQIRSNINHCSPQPDTCWGGGPCRILSRCHGLILSFCSLQQNDIVVSHGTVQFRYRYKINIPVPHAIRCISAFVATLYIPEHCNLTYVGDLTSGAITDK